MAVRAVIADALLPLAVPLDTLTLDPVNARRGDVAAIRRSLNVFGQRKPIVVRKTGADAAGNPTGIVMAGNHTLLAATELEWSHVAAVFIADDETTAKAYALADNRTGELADWDQDQLAATLRELSGDVDMTALGWTSDELAEMLATEIGEDDDDPGAGEDGAHGPASEPVSVPGDLWLLGRHRLLCGDTTDPAHLDTVLDGLDPPGIVYTDPPYGISAVNKAGNVGGGSGPGARGLKGKHAEAPIPPRVYLPVTGDGTIDAAADAFRLLGSAFPAARHVWWGANHYAASVGLPDGSCWLVWDKETGGNDFADAELAWTNAPGAVRLLRHMWSGLARASERFAAAGPRLHPTQKPVALAEWAFGVVDKDASRHVVFDGFGGSGSTLIAADRTGRTAAVLEIEPGYVDVICRRFQKATGIVPVLASTGAPHDFLTDDDGG